MKSVDLIKKEKIDFLLAVGGGSVIDGTKFINLAVNYEGENPYELLFHGFNPVTVLKSLPIGTVITLPAAGSEMNSGAVVTYNQAKFVVFSPQNFPKFSILDPTITLL